MKEKFCIVRLPNHCFIAKCVLMQEHENIVIVKSDGNNMWFVVFKNELFDTNSEAEAKLAELQGDRE